MIHRYSFPTNILFGSGSASEVGGLARLLGCARALIVTDRVIVSAGLTAPVERSLEAAGVYWSRFDGVSPNPTDDNVARGTEARDGADLIVAIGGGSAIDAGKAIRLCATHHLPLEEYDDNTGGGDKIRDRLLPMIAVPTTAGTGSEIGRSTVIYCRATDRKTVIFSPFLMPTFAVADPDLTLGLPPPITAATGMDALTHSLEAYLSTPCHPMADAIALGGIRLCDQSLKRAVNDGADMDARSDMMMAAMMGATAFQKGLGVTHSLAHPLSSVAGLHHGRANAVLLPFVLEFNAPACRERLCEVARTLRIPETPDAVIQWVRDLNQSIGLPATLSECGVAASQIPVMVPKAIEDGCHRTNPRPCSAEEMAALYFAAL